MSLPLEEQNYYDRVVAAPNDYSINDLRRAYYIGVLSSDLTPGGPLSTFEQYVINEIATPGTDLNTAFQGSIPLTDTTLVEDPNDEGTYIIVPNV